MKRTKMSVFWPLKGVVSCTVVTVAAVACAETGVWTDATLTDVTKGQYREWTDGGNWQNGYVPGGLGREGDAANIPTDPVATDGKDMMRLIRLPTGGIFTNAVLSGTAQNKLLSYNDNSLKKESAYVFTDISDYLGYVELGLPFGLNFLGATTINHLCLGMQPIVNVEGAADTVTVADTYGWGKLFKKGPGKIKFAGWGGEHQRLQVAGSGEVELTGLPTETDVLQPATTPYIWLDASATNRMTLVENPDGSLTVSRWQDARSTVNRAAGPSSGCSCPKLVKRSEDGLWVVDFGDYSVEVPAEERAERCARMSFEGDYNRIFYNLYVVFASNADEHVPPLLGYGTSTDLQQCTDSVSGPWSQYWATGNGRIALKLGDNRMDGNRIWFDEACHLSGWHVLSGTATSQFRVRELCFVRGGGYGGARLAEVILYNRVLSEEENRQTIRYLQRKWTKGLADDRGEDWDFGVVHLNDDTTVRVPAARTAKVKVLSTSDARMLTVTGGGTLETELVGTPPKGVTYTDYWKGKTAAGGSEPMPVQVSAGTLRIRKTTPTLSTKTVAELFASVPQDMSGRYDPSVPGSVIESEGVVTQWKNLANENGGAWYPGTGETAAPTLVTGGINGLNSINCRPFATRAANVDKYPCFIFNNTAMGTRNDSQGVVEFFMVMCQECCGDVGQCYPIGNMNSRWMAPMSVGALAGGHYNAALPTQFGSAMPQALYALDGVPLYQGTYAMITNAVVFSVANNVAMPLNTFGRYANTISGGFEYGEIITYDRRLSPAERRAVEAYLLKKWKNLDHPYDAARKMGEISVAAAGTLAVDAQAAVDVSGNLAVAEGGTLEFGFAADETSPKAIVSGTLALGDRATVRITSSPAELPENGRIILARAATIDADADALTVEVPAELTGGALKVRHGELRYQMPRGLILLVR